MRGLRQKKVSRRLDELQESGKSRIESDLNTSALSKVTGLHLLDEHQKGISPFLPRIKESYLPDEFAVRVKVGSLQEARDKHGLTALALLAVSPSKVDDSDLDDSKDSGSGTRGTAKGKLEIPLPVFTGKRLDLYARDFLRYLRMKGQKAADEMTRADLIVTGCKNEWLRGVVDDILATSESWVHFLKQVESAFPHFETDASIRGALEKVQKLKELPTPADVRQLLQKLKSLMTQLKIPMSETAKGKLEIPLPVFTGKRLDLYARDFVRYLRMTGQKAADEMTRADLIVTGCKNEWLRGVVDDILTTSESWVHFLKQVESAFPHFETDASIRGALGKVQKLKELPTPADVRQLLQKLKSLMTQLKIPMSETEKLLLLTRKIQKKTWTECRSTVERKAKTHTY